MRDYIAGRLAAHQALEHSMPSAEPGLRAIFNNTLGAPHVHNQDLNLNTASIVDGRRCHQLDMDKP